MPRKIILGNVYFNWKGEEFIPVEMEKGAFKKNNSFWCDLGQRKPSIYIDKDGRRLGKDKIYNDKFGSLKVGHKVSHDDYSDEDFIVTKIDKETNIVTTKGGKNGIWINPVELIIRKYK